MHRSKYVATVGFLGALFLAQACGSDDPVTKAVGDGCLLPTDCTDPLVCVFRKCHQQCLLDRDCPTAQRCTGALAPKKGICLLPDEVNCSRNSDCEFPLVCGRTGQCQQQCAANVDCLSSQTCVSGTCFDMESAPDGGLDGGKVGETCSLASDCNAGLVCIGGKCTVECREDRDCRTDESCRDSRCYKGGAGSDAGVDAVADAPADVPPGYGASCVYPTDCTYPLVCRASGVCAWECNKDGDCKSTEVCKDHFCVVRPPDSGVTDAAPDVVDAEVGKACSSAGECDDGKWCNGPERCLGGFCAPAIEGPCTSHSACVTDTCAEATKTCTHTPTTGLDVDGDGHLALGCGGDDCDDKDPTVYKGALELCDGKDNDCDGKIDNHAVSARGKEASIVLPTARNRVLATALGGKWVVVTGATATNAIQAFSVDATGTASVEKTLATGPSYVIPGSIATGGDHALLVYNTNSIQKSALLLKPDLTTIATVGLSIDGANPKADSVAWNGTQYLVAFLRSGKVTLAFLQPDGTIVGGVRTLVDGAGGVAVGTSVAVGAIGTTHLVAYTPNGTKMQFALLGPTGDVIAGPTVISTATTSVKPSSVVTTPSGFLVLWTSSLVLRGTFVSSTGVVGSTVDLAGGEPSAFVSIGSSLGAVVTTTAGDQRFDWYDKGLAGSVESSLPFPAIGGSLENALAALPGPQFGLFALATGTDLRFARIGCAP